MQITSKLELQVADIEAFQETSFCHWNVLLSGGFSYASIVQDYGEAAIPGHVAAGNSAPVNSHTTFEGWGPVFALEAAQAALL